MMSPATKLLTASLFALFVALLTIWSVTQRTWFGMTLVPSEEGHVQLLHIDPSIFAVQADSFSLPAVVEAIRVDDTLFPLEATDIIEEPDVFESYEELQRFLLRQQTLSNRLKSGHITLQLQSETADAQFVTLHGAQSRPIRDLPLPFWVQLITGVGGFIIGWWVLALRPRDMAARAFMLTGAALMLSAFSAAIYSSRELALGASFFAVLMELNLAGALGFGFALMALFLYFPRPLVSDRWLVGLVAIFFGYMSFKVGFKPNAQASAVYTPVVLLSVGILTLIGVQWWRNRRNPQAIAALRWFGLVTFATISCFLALAAIPIMFGDVPAVPQGIAFGFFLILYAGLALGLKRYRLFELDRWAFHLLVFVLAGLSLIAVDILFLAVLQWNETPSILASLVICGFLYLPLRGWLWRRLVERQRPDAHSLFQQIVDISLAPTAQEYEDRWHQLLEKLFDPLTTEPVEGDLFPSLQNNGETLYIPAVSHTSGMHLILADKGKRLFSRSDQSLAQEIIDMLHYVNENRNAWEKGRTEERKRIAQDLHDDLGSRLLTGLRQNDIPELHQTMRLAVADMRSIVRGLAGETMPLSQILAELRQESMTRCELSNIAITWPYNAIEPDDWTLDYTASRHLMSAIRELFSNIIQHAHATTIGVSLHIKRDHLQLKIEDDGQGYDGSGSREGGHGTQNLQKRMETIHGSLTFTPLAHGTCAELVVPLRRGSTSL